MIVFLGQVALLTALVAAILQTLLPHSSRLRLPPPLAQVKVLVHLHLLALMVAFGALVWSFAVSDFSLSLVAQHSHSAKPLIYRITGSWGNHEGSMLLWALVLALYGSALALFPRPLPDALLATTLRIHGAVATGFLLYILLASNPLLRLEFPPPEGLGLNPLLQDIGLAIHPPMLYLGYVGSGLLFCLALAALLHAEASAELARGIRRWVLLSWSGLTLGIGLGAWWAYRELGWGGWWFWDPVENVALMPWLALTALLHANLLLEKRGLCARLVILLCISSFGLSLVGTFIVRSGLLTSVHAFASDPTRGIFMLIYIALAMGSGLWIYARHAAAPPPQEKPALVSRETAILINNWLLIAACASILIAIIYPIILELAQLGSITVGAPYYNQVILPLLAPLIILAAIIPGLNWGLGKFSSTARKLGVSFLLSLAVAGAIILKDLPHAPLAAAGIGMGIFLILSSLHHGLRQWRLDSLSRRSLGMVIAHAGGGVFMVGVVASSFWKTQVEANVAVGESFTFAPYEVTLLRDEAAVVENYISKRSELRFTQNKSDVALLAPEMRIYPIEQQETVEASIDYGVWQDLYAIRDQGSQEKRVSFQVSALPGMFLIWLGFAMAALGGIVAAITPKAHQNP